MAVQQITWYCSRTAYWLLIKGPIKGTLTDDSVWPEENDIRRRFQSDEGAASTLLFHFKNRQTRERSERAREPVALVVIKSPAVFIFIREIDYFQRENRSTIAKEKVEGL